MQLRGQRVLTEFRTVSRLAGLDPQYLECRFAGDDRFPCTSGITERRRHGLRVFEGDKDLERRLAAPAPGRDDGLDSGDLRNRDVLWFDPQCGADRRRHDIRRARTLDRKARKFGASIEDLHVIRDHELRKPRDRGNRSRRIGFEPHRVGPRDDVEVGDDATFARERERMATRVGRRRIELGDVVRELTLQESHTIGPANLEQRAARETEDPRRSSHREHFLRNAHRDASGDAVACSGSGSGP